MSAGNKIIPVRVSDVMDQEIHLAIQSRNSHSKGEVWTVSDFIRAAVEDKLLHLMRGRKKRRRDAKVKLGLQDKEKAIMDYSI
jgi:hypothetical protein